MHCLLLPPPAGPADCGRLKTGARVTLSCRGSSWIKFLCGISFVVVVADEAVVAADEVEDWLDLLSVWLLACFLCHGVNMILFVNPFFQQITSVYFVPGVNSVRHVYLKNINPSTVAQMVERSS